jgi:hypothetical protein
MISSRRRVSVSHHGQCPGSTFKAYWKRQQRAQPHALGGLEQRVIEPWLCVAGHLQAKREVDAGAGRDSYPAGQEPKAARIDATIGFSDQIAPHKADLSRDRAVVPQPGMNFGSAAGWSGAPGAQDRQGCDRWRPLIRGRVRHGGRRWPRRGGRWPWWREKVEDGIQHSAELGRQPLRTQKVTMMCRPCLARGGDISEGATLDLITQDGGCPLSER